MTKTRDSILVRIDLDAAISNEEKNRLVELIATEMEFGDLREQRYHKRGWSMGHSRVINVIRVGKPAPAPRSRNIEIEGIVLDSAVSPDNPVSGRFIARGKVARGLKSIIGRTVEVRLDAVQAKSLSEDAARWVKEYPSTGIEAPAPSDDEE